ncbi:MAG: hypothetical protein IKW74_05035 [Thermoguttaceae bacterium]|nr:hypothetical protein [Thermoguttaceae bacterium]
MYTKYWELTRKPFEIGCDPIFYYPGELHQTALLKIRYTVENRLGNALLQGVPGSGKSMLVTMLKQYEAKNGLGPFLSLPMPQLCADEILGYLADRCCKLSERLTDNMDSVRYLRRKQNQDERNPYRHLAFETVETFLYQNSNDNRHCVLVVEDVHLINDPSAFPFFKTLLGLQRNGRPVLSLMLVVTTPAKLSDQFLSFVDDCVDVKAELPLLTMTETSEYIIHRLKQSGAEEREIFTPEAMTKVYHLTGGLPRKINRLCDLALLTGFAEKLEKLDSDLIEALNQEMINNL